MANWQDKIDLSLKDHLKRQIDETHNSKEAMLSSDNPKLTQLWIAIANLSREIFEVNLRLKYLERAMRDMSRVERTTVVETRKPSEEIEKALKLVLAGKKKTPDKKTVKKKTTKKKTKKK
ncbi:MAG: hypothetical protein ABIJ20_04360 [Nanoarchaeota archaeon]|nr:hypothetical protein [Nanoarchaeota archaeon]MBU1444828.1 hypothetical protein [Nanoarchaeota archaeon]MBU2419996.1 hypothetical protein [Nanoarchaeota archaeon]MBU2475437.1 hypothetical protein [Nanoarchaeota archaeon]